MFVKHISGSFTLLKDNALGVNFPTQNLTPLAGFIVCDMSSRVSYWWVIWGELQGYGDPIHGQGTRESWRETFSKPSPPLPLTPSSWCIQPKGERHRLHCDLQPLHCSCIPLCICPLTTGIPLSLFPFLIPSTSSFWKYRAHSWSEYIQETGQLPIDGDLAHREVENGHCREGRGQFLGSFASWV